MVSNVLSSPSPSAGAPVALDILVHVLKIIIQLLHPVGLASRREHQLVTVVPVLIVPDIPGISRLLFLLLGLLQAVALVPDLESAPRQDQQGLHIVLKLGALAAGGEEPPRGPTQLP